MKKLLMLSLLLPFFSNTMEIEKKNLQVPGRLGNISVFKTDNGFEIEESNSRRVEVPSHRVNKDLRRMNMRQLAKFTKAGYIAINQSDDGQYSLQSHGRLRAGGPVLAGFLYGVTKATAYTIGLVAGGAAVGSFVGTPVGPILGGIYGWLGCTSFVAGSVGAPAVVAAAAASGSVLATEAAMTVTAVGGTLGFAGINAAIEAAAMYAFAAGLAAPTP